MSLVLDADFVMLLRCRAHRLMSVLERGAHMLAFELRHKATRLTYWLEGVIPLRLAFWWSTRLSRLAQNAIFTSTI